MSGGSYNYLYSRIKDEYVGDMFDEEIEEMTIDFCQVLHDLEWWQSCDYSEDRYRESLKNFKEKWFKGKREAAVKDLLIIRQTKFNYSPEDLQKMRENITKQRDEGIILLPYTCEVITAPEDVRIEFEDRKKDEWIPCTKRLPEEDQYVLASVRPENAQYRVIISRFRDNEYWHDGRIQAWKPLPEPYEEEEE